MWSFCALGWSNLPECLLQQRKVRKCEISFSYYYLIPASLCFEQTARSIAHCSFRCTVFNTCEFYDTFHGPDCSLGWQIIRSDFFYILHDTYLAPLPPSKKVQCPEGKAWQMPAIVDDNAHELVECSNRGKCVRETGDCLCASGFTGKACEWKPNPNPNPDMDPKPNLIKPQTQP